MIRIALDGPSGAGKSYLAKKIAASLGIVYLDTGALYRTVGLYMKRNGVDISDRESVGAHLPGITLALAFDDAGQHVILNGEDVSGMIRTPEISMYASAVSAIPSVRAFLLETQKRIGRENSVIMDGRDIGTVIMPDADVKIFLVASPEARAKRRYLELKEKGEDCVYEDVLADMIRRDRNDSTRDIAPAVAAADAVTLDNSDLTPEETVRAALDIIERKTGEAGNR